MNAYELTQRQREAEYRAAYAEWVAGLTADEVDELHRLGLDRPSVPANGVGLPGGDPADSPAARCAPDDLEPEMEAETYHDILRRLVGELLAQDNTRLSLECLALATGLAYLGDSMTVIAKRHGVTRAAVSKRCVELTRALNLQPSRAMRSVAARRSYSAARHRHLNPER